MPDRWRRILPRRRSGAEKERKQRPQGRGLETEIMEARHSVSCRARPGTARAARFRPAPPACTTGVSCLLTKPMPARLARASTAQGDKAGSARPAIAPYRLLTPCPWPLSSAFACSSAPQRLCANPLPAASTHLVCILTPPSFPEFYTDQEIIERLQDAIREAGVAIQES